MPFAVLRVGQSSNCSSGGPRNSQTSIVPTLAMQLPLLSPGKNRPLHIGSGVVDGATTGAVYLSIPLHGRSLALAQQAPLATFNAPRSHASPGISQRGEVESARQQTSIELARGSSTPAEIEPSRDRQCTHGLDPVSGSHPGASRLPSGPPTSVMVVEESRAARRSHPGSHPKPAWGGGGEGGRSAPRPSGAHGPTPRQRSQDAGLAGASFSFVAGG
jgi:hypothetical protein